MPYQIETISNKSARSRSAARTRFLDKNGVAVLPVTVESSPNPAPQC